MIAEKNPKKNLKNKTNNYYCLKLRSKVRQMQIRIFRRERGRERERELQNRFKQIKESDGRVNVSLSIYTVKLHKITTSKIEN